MSRIRIGTVGYLNARPLTDHLDRERYDVLADHPRAIAEALASGAVDVALVPVAAALSDADYRIVPGWCIGADGAVDSVAIFAETDPSAWTELVLDGQSRTSQTLARLLVAEGPLATEVSPDLVVTEVAPGEAPSRVGGTVAGLVIGDPAREMPTSLRTWDLGALWTAWTGKPFVFAVWAARQALPADVVADLRAAGSAGVAELPTRYEGDDLTYLTERIRFPLDEAALMGLRRYASLALRAGLVASEHVHLFGPAVTRRPRSLDLDAVLAAAVSGRAPSAEQALRLLEEAPDTDLGVAAQAVRGVRRAPGEATYLVEHRAEVARVAAGGQGLDDLLDGALASEATALRLHGLDRLADGQRRARLRRAAATGLQVVGVDLGALTALAQLDGVGVGGLTEGLVADGLGGLDWLVGDAGCDRAVLDVAVRVGLPIAAHVVIARGTRPAQIVQRLGLIARLQADTHAFTSVALHLLMPEGALVEPGSPTTSTWLRAVAAARLMLPTEVSVVASPATQGLDLSQAALFSGADDLGPVGLGPSMLLGTGAGFQVDVGAAERALRVAGLDAHRRNLRFALVGGPLTKLSRVRPMSARAVILDTAPPTP